MMLDWTWIGERAPAALSVAKDITLAGAAISTSIVGWRALGKWREETIGKRRLELAEDVLTAFYQVQELIRQARSPFIDAREMAPEEGVPEEVRTDPAYAVRRRLSDSFDKVLELRTKRHRFAALFGQQATSAWADIEAVLTDLDTACGGLLALEGERVPANDPNAAFYIELRQIAFRSPRGDTITPRVEKIISDVEAVCRPVIQASVRR